MIVTRHVDFNKQFYPSLHKHTFCSPAEPSEKINGSILQQNEKKGSMTFVRLLSSPYEGGDEKNVEIRQQSELDENARELVCHPRMAD